jgi:hypothetical protein
MRSFALVLAVACAGSPQWVGEHRPSDLDCSYGRVCGPREYCEIDVPLDHTSTAPDGEVHHGHSDVPRCRALPAHCQRPFDCACLRAAHLPISRCEEENLGNGLSRVTVFVERDASGHVLPFTCDEVRCDAGSYCVQSEESAECRPLPAQCDSCDCLGGECQNVGGQLRVLVPPPP